MIGTSNTFGHSFGAEPFVSPERRQRAADAHKARLNALPAECRPWMDRLTAQGVDALAVVVRAYKAAGEVPCPMPRAEIAEALGVTPDGADRILGRLVEVGAVQREDRLAQAPRFRPVTAPQSPLPVQARKADPKPAPVRKAAPVADARLKAGLVGLRDHREPEAMNLRAGLVGADPRR